MKISIITPSYNSAATISDTLDSIASQTHQDLEYVIVDGASTDRTLDIIGGYRDRLAIKVLSEPDSGLYDAMNKGIGLVNGDIVGILNSDDFYYDQDVLSKVNAAFESHPDIDAVYGDLVYVDKDDIAKQVRYWQSGEYRERNLNGGWIIPHPTFFVRREVYARCHQLFNTRFSLAADYELILRLLKVDKIKVYYLPEILVKMRTGGSSGRDWKQRLTGWRELRAAWKVNSLAIPRFFITRRVLGKLGQFLFKS